jgi:hypothetical protein
MTIQSRTKRGRTHPERTPAAPVRRGLAGQPFQKPEVGVRLSMGKNKTKTAIKARILASKKTLKVQVEEGTGEKA